MRRCKTMEEVGGALVSIALVLCAVFVPTAFLGGISGQFFQQFAITIAVATAISCFCSLTLSPALASLILQPHEEKRPPASWNFIARGWDSIHRRLQPRLRPAVARLCQRGRLRDPAFGGDAADLCGADRQRRLAAGRPRRRASFRRRIAATSSSRRNCPARRRWRAPPRSSARSRRSRWIRPGIVRVAAFAGFSGATRTQAGNAAALFPVFDEPEARLKKGLTAAAITADLRKRLSAIEGAFIIVIPPPAVPGIGTGGGFTMRIQDRQGRGPELLAAATDELVAAARKAPGLTSVFSPFTANTPQVFVDIDRIKAQKLGVPIAERHRHDRDLFRLDLCQRLQPVRPHLSRHRAGRSAVPQGDRRSGAAAHPQCRRRHGDARQRGGFPRHLRTRPRRALQSLSGVRTAGRTAAGHEFGDRASTP